MYSDSTSVILHPGWNLSRTNRVKRWFIYDDCRKHRSEYLDMLDVFINYCAELFDYMLFRQGKGDAERAIPFRDFQLTLKSAIECDNRPTLTPRVKGQFSNWACSLADVILSISRASHVTVF